MNYAEFGQSIKRQHPEYADIPDEELGQKVLAKYPQYSDMVTTPSDESFGRYAEPQIIPFVQNLFNIPNMVTQAGQEIRDKGPFAAPSPQLRKLAGGTTTDTGSSILNAALDAAKQTRTEIGAGADIGTGAAFIKALIPYLTYGGVNKLKDTLASQDPNRFQGKDIEESLTSKLTSGSKLGNVASDVQTAVNDLLTRRMPGGFSRLQNYGAGDLGQFAKNIGMAEPEGYSSTSTPGMVRSAVTSLVKDIVPETQFPYQASTFLNKIGSVPGVGWLLKNPITWPVATNGGTKVPGVVKAVLGGK